jgi:hypothetical protein
MDHLADGDSMPNGLKAGTMIAQAGAECSSANIDAPPAALISLMTFGLRA